MTIRLGQILKLRSLEIFRLAALNCEDRTKEKQNVTTIANLVETRFNSKQHTAVSCSKNIAITYTGAIIRSNY